MAEAPVICAAVNAQSTIYAVADAQSKGELAMMPDKAKVVLLEKRIEDLLAAKVCRDTALHALCMACCASLRHTLSMYSCLISCR